MKTVTERLAECTVATGYPSIAEVALIEAGKDVDALTGEERRDLLGGSPCYYCGCSPCRCHE